MATVVPSHRDYVGCRSALDELTVPRDTLARCDCGRWFYFGRMCQGAGPQPDGWIPVGWWQLGRRLQIRRANR